MGAGNLLVLNTVVADLDPRIDSTFDEHCPTLALIWSSLDLSLSTLRSTLEKMSSMVLFKGFLEGNISMMIMSGASGIIRYERRR